MEKNEWENLKWLEFSLLNEIKGIAHASFTRHGGKSKKPYDSLNVAYDVGDDAENVTQNIRLIKETIEIETLYWAKQVHGVEIVKIRKPLESLPECDAFITDQTNVGLMIKHADCQAALFVDPINRAIGAVHAGWRGSVQNIYREVVRRMKAEYGSRPENLLVGISPSLGPQAAEFVNYEKELPKPFREFQVKDCYFDFWAISREQLKAEGVLDHHIEIAEICTYGNEIDFFSYRRNNVTGRHATVIQLNAR